jgi:hypothetical protein
VEELLWRTKWSFGIAEGRREGSMARLHWDELIVQDISPEEFRDWIAPWSGVVTGQVAPAFMSKFGFWFLRRLDGTVEILDVFAGTLERVADTYEGFLREVNEQWWQEVYLLSELVVQLHQAGKVPGPGQCYALCPHPALGGPNPINGDVVDSRFVMIMDTAIWQSLCVQSFTTGANGRG